ncbi:MAG: SPBc2 prophage-derived aminoglycoside N(3')-acetyltransferase-like protein YokD [bacterium ADurb.Bin429]|nr:MAG: SPBc2 prophage-derived aminoglycoside N(3')-acetyltransferase-like protein YokD [bacterium ADurb.Bin429]
MGATPLRWVAHYQQPESMIMLTKSDLVAAFRKVGLIEGDLVLVHSALRTLGPVEGGADSVIDALLETVGPAGTVAVPTHTWKIVNGAQPVFHQTLSPANVGALTNVFRLRPNALRNLHPTHSVAAIGPRAAEFIACPNMTTPAQPDSPYGKLRDWGGKVLIIGPGLECCTFFHGCEQWAGMPRAVSEQPVQLYSITADGQVIPVLLRHHVVNTWDQYPKLEPYLLEIGALTIGKAGDCDLRLLDAAKAAAWLVPQLQKDPSIILPEPSSSEP